eukprot:7184022-Alexandrium_andersonii.AAC.1
MAKEPLGPGSTRANWAPRWVRAGPRGASRRREKMVACLYEPVCPTTKQSTTSFLNESAWPGT